MSKEMNYPVHTIVCGDRPMCVFRQLSDHESIEYTFRWLIDRLWPGEHPYHFRLATISERAVWSRAMAEHVAEMDKRCLPYSEIANVLLPGWKETEQAIGKP
jgi:hypothetical protein